MPNWREQHYRVEGTGVGRRRRTYKLQDIHGQTVPGTYYPEELQSIGKNDYSVERVLRRRIRSDGIEEVFVKWKGWPEKYNTWVGVDDNGKPVTEHGPQ